jgi:hypothetical protein
MKVTDDMVKAAEMIHRLEGTTREAIKAALDASPANEMLAALKAVRPYLGSIPKHQDAVIAAIVKAEGQLGT